MTNQLQDIYNQFASTYEENRGQFDMNHILESFFNTLNNNPRSTLEESHLLDLGCGSGEPVSRFFQDKNWTITGVDFSERMLELAKKYVPKMNRIHSDLSAVDFANQQFDAITASYSLFHIPAQKHLEIFSKMNRWLKPNGLALFTYATKEYTGSQEFDGYKQFMGQSLYYSHKNTDALYDDLDKIGFERLSSDFHTIGNETFLWVTVKKS